MLKAACHKYILQFKQPAGTSRGVMLDKETWYLFVWDDGRPETVGTGECSVLRGLSCDDRPDYADRMQWLCDNIHMPASELYEALIFWPSIRFGLETALADLSSGGCRIPFPSSFTEGNCTIPINGLVWMGEFAYMRQQIEEKLTQGFRVIKMKVGAIDFEREVDLLQSIRELYSPEEIEIRLDANGAFLPDEVSGKFEILARFGIHSIEQPIAPGKPGVMARICRESPIPVALDEELIGVHYKDDKRRLLEQIRPQYIILKPALLGGFTACSEWITLAGEFGIGWWVTSALESNVGLNAIAQWTATLGNPMPQGLGTGSLYVNNINSPLKVSGGYLHYDPSGSWDLNRLSLPDAGKPGWDVPLTLNGKTATGAEWIREAEIWKLSAEGEEWMADLGNFLRQWYSGEEYITVHTSGSTGKPKEIRLKKSAMIRSAQATRDYLRLQDHPDALLCLSARFIAGMMMVVRAMVCSQNLIAVKPAGNPLMLLEGQNVPSFAAMVPAQVYNCLCDPVTRKRLESIRTLIIGGGEVSYTLEQEIRQLPHAVYATFGMTETITHIALRRINGPDPEELYEALPGITFSTDNRSCLVVHAPYISREPVVTNDLVEMTGNRAFTWRGRIDHVINRGGQKLVPEEIEKMLAPHIDRRFFIGALPDPKFGELPVLVVESAGSDSDDQFFFLQLVEKYVPKNERPARIIIIGRFLETPGGKVNRRETLRLMNSGSCSTP